MFGMKSKLSSRTVLGWALFVAIVAGMVFVLMGKKRPQTITVAPTESKSGAPAIAPIGEFPPETGGIVQREDGRVFIYSGSGSVSIKPLKSGAWDYSFGYKPREGSPVDPVEWDSLVKVRQNRSLQLEMGLSADQIKHLQDFGGHVPCPEAQRKAVSASFMKYVAAAPGAEREAAQAALLENVRKAGEVQGPLAHAWLDARLAVLSDEQQAQLNASMAAGRKRATQN